MHSLDLWRFRAIFSIGFIVPSGLPRWFSDKESCQCRRCGFDPWVRKIPWRMKWQPTPVFLPGKSQRQRSLEGYSPWGRKRIICDLVTKQQQMWRCGSRSVVSNSLWPHGLCSPPSSSVRGILQAGIAGVGCHSLIQGIWHMLGYCGCLLDFSFVARPHRAEELLSVDTVTDYRIKLHKFCSLHVKCMLFIKLTCRISVI